MILQSSGPTTRESTWFRVWDSRFKDWGLGLRFEVIDLSVVRADYERNRKIERGIERNKRKIKQRAAFLTWKQSQISQRASEPVSQ